MLKIPTTIRVFMYEPKIDDMIGNAEPMIDERPKIYDQLQIDSICSKLDERKQQVVRALVNGDNFSQIGKALNLKTNEIYTIKLELQHDLAYLLNGKKTKMPFDDFLGRIKDKVKDMSLNEFVKIFICDYEKNTNHIIEIAVNNGVFEQWENDNKNIVFEDWQTKAVIVAGYLLKVLFLRQKPVCFDYYSKNKLFLVALIKNIKAMIKISPLLHYDLQCLGSTDDFEIKFKDTSTIRAFHKRGKKAKNIGGIVVIDNCLDEINFTGGKVKRGKTLIKTIFKQVNATVLNVNSKFV